MKLCTCVRAGICVYVCALVNVRGGSGFAFFKGLYHQEYEQFFFETRYHIQEIP